MFNAKYRNLTDNGNTQGSCICYYYDNILKYYPDDLKEIREVEKYMKEVSGQSDTKEAYHWIIRDAIEWATTVGC